MKRIITLIHILAVTGIVAQVGINTQNPQQEVHLAGSVENVRIDGLNAVNNVNNLGNGSTTRVLVDANGDLVLGATDEVPIEIFVDSENYLEDEETPGSIVLQTGNGFGFNGTGVVLDVAQSTFTLTKNAILEINYSVTWDSYHVFHHDFKRMSDARARIVQTGIYFRQDDPSGPAVINDADGIPINGGPWCINPDSGSQNSCLEEAGLLALNGQFYKNYDAVEGAYTGFRNTATDYVKLGPGTYIAMFAARMEVSDTQGSGESRIYLGTKNDELQIVAYYYN
jgi:hypothetical protein